MPHELHSKKSDLLLLYYDFVTICVKENKIAKIELELKNKM